MNFISRATVGTKLPAASDPAVPVALREIDGFGANPGDLRLLAFEPAHRPRPCPAVVVLHGCGQTAAGFDAASGWSRLAAAYGFALLYPEQTRSNNDRNCFSWFNPADVARETGEAGSIRQMIGHAVDALALDARRVFVCGLSAGGAMAGAMLAAYPELFAGGAIVAGLPYGAASSASEALDAMYVGKVKDAPRWGDAVRAASGHDGPWPSVAIWYGTHDTVVKPINAGELVKQWTNVHGIGATAPEVDLVGPATRRVWRDGGGRACVSAYMVPDVGHGVPIDERDPPAPFFLPAGIAATRQIAADFGLIARGAPHGVLPRAGGHPGAAPVRRDARP